VDTITNLIRTLFSEDFFLRFGPILFVLDNLILLIYFYRIQSCKTLEEAKKEKSFYWKQLAWKSGFFIYFLWMILSDRPWISHRMLYLAAWYYAYAVLVVVIFIMYWVRNLVWYLWPNSVPKSVMPSADSQEQAKGRSGDAVGLLKQQGVGRVIAFVIMIVLVNAGIIFLVSGGLDKYFGVNKTADYHDLGKIIDAGFCVLWLVTAGLFVVPVLYSVATNMFGRHNPSIDEPSPTNQKSAPNTTDVDLGGRWTSSNYCFSRPAKLSNS